MKNILSMIFWMKRNIRYLPSILSLVMVQFLFLGSFSLVYAKASQVERWLDVTEAYSEGYTATVLTTGDTMSGATVQDTEAWSLFGWSGRNLFGTDTFVAYGDSVGVTDSDLSASTKTGLINSTDDQIISMLYNPPSVDIPSHLARQWIPGADSSSTSVMAADTGFSHLQDLGIEQVWIMFRNMAYVGFVLILVATGFMIMFRSKIGGQTAVTVMNSLPSIGVGLVLVTFSFALVGFAIDLSRLLTAIISSLLEQSLPNIEVVPLGGPLQMAKYAFGGVWDATWSIPSKGLLSGAVGQIVTIFSAGPKLIFSVILGFVAMYAAFKLFFTLVMSYVKILMDLVLGPIYILVGSLPGSSNNIKDWIKRLLVNSLTFPIVFFMVNLFRYIGDPSITNPLTSNFAGFMGGGNSLGDPLIQLKGAVVLVGYFVAATAPSIVSDIFQLKESPGASKSAQDIQKSMSKIPLVGGLFGS